MINHYALVGAALAATIAVSLTHGWLMEASMCIAGVLWTITIVLIQKRKCGQ
jgi:hypothetical protein